MQLLTVNSGSLLTWIDYSILIVLLLLFLSLGFIFGRKKSNVKEFLLAGRSMKSLLVSISILASVFSGIGFLGFPAEAYGYGMGYSLLAFTSFITTPFINAIFMPFFYRVRLYTAYQYLEERFAFGLRTLIAIIFVCRTLLWMSIVVYAPALALEQVTGFPLWVMIACMGVVATAYTTMGGMTAVVWGNVLKFSLLMGGLLSMVAVAIYHVPGGFSGVVDVAAQARKLDFSLSWDPAIRVTVWGILIGGTVHNLVLLATDQVSIQQYMASKNIKTARKAMWLKAYLWVPCAFFFYFAGIALYAFYQSAGQDPLASGLISKSDQILPYFAVNQMPVGFAGLLIAGIVAASMSSMASGINSVTTVSLVDLYERYADKQLGELQKVRFARKMAIAFGAAATIIAFGAERFGSLIEAPVKIFGLLGGPLFGLFLLGMLSKRANASGAITGWIAGTIAAFFLAFQTNISFLWYAVSGLTVCYAVGWICSVLGKRPPQHKVEGFTWSTRYETEEMKAKNDE